MAARRKPVRERDIVSFGRRTPRFNLVSLKEEVMETTKVAKIISPSVFHAPKTIKPNSQPSNEDSPFLFQ